jgi:hypothetical protein
MKIALVHDYLNQRGGAERVVEVFHKIFPDAPIYCSFYDPDGTFPSFKKADVRVSFIQRLPFIKRFYKNYLSLYPYAFESFDLKGYDAVLSSSSAFAKGILTQPETCHINYCHTPARFAWMTRQYMENNRFPAPLRSYLERQISRIREWDYVAAQRVDHYIATPKVVADRIMKF